MPPYRRPVFFNQLYERRVEGLHLIVPAFGDDLLNLVGLGWILMKSVMRPVVTTTSQAAAPLAALSARKTLTEELNDDDLKGSLASMALIWLLSCGGKRRIVQITVLVASNLLSALKPGAWSPPWKGAIRAVSDARISLHKNDPGPASRCPSRRTPQRSICSRPT